MDKKLIQYISWYYTTITPCIVQGPVTYHLIRLKDGRGLLKSDSEMVALGLAEWRTGK